MKKGEDYIGVAVVFICHDGAGKYFLSKRGEHCRDEQGRWDCGGGAVDFGDTAEETLRREIREEYGARVLSFEFMGYRDVLREQVGKKTHWLSLDFKVLIDPKEAKNAEPHKFDAVGWFPLSNFPEPLHSQLPYFLEKYREKLHS